MSLVKELNEACDVKVWSNDDWGGVYVNGELVSEGHNPNREFVMWLDDVGKCNIRSFETGDFSDDEEHPFGLYVRDNGCCPKTLKEIGER